MKNWSKAKKIGWWVFMVWTVLAGLFVSWGTPLLAIPSNGQIVLLLELTALGFMVAFALTLFLEIWAQMLRRHPADRRSRIGQH
ncbi:hypothetical protein [Paraburkholderia sediminicola]|uniref:hypothetical protein n=1 Tax=Paraburkholderia sediminicola TaxID=458836 RepID=UPI0038BC23BC